MAAAGVAGPVATAAAAAAPASEAAEAMDGVEGVFVPEARSGDFPLTLLHTGHWSRVSVFLLPVVRTAEMMRMFSVLY